MSGEGERESGRDEGREFFERMERLAADGPGASEAVHQIAADSRRSQNDSPGYPDGDSGREPDGGPRFYFGPVGKSLPEPDSRGSQIDSDGYQPQNEGPTPDGPTRDRLVRPGTAKQRRMDPAGGWLPGDRLAEDPPRGQHPERKTRRLGIRLKHSQYSMLKGAAELYGVRPTTMARMLINRGAQAVVRSYLGAEQDLKGSAEYD